jgi:hypothetical protein
MEAHKTETSGFCEPVSDDVSFGDPSISTEYFVQQGVRVVKRNILHINSPHVELFQEFSFLVSLEKRSAHNFPSNQGVIFFNDVIE